MIQKYHFIAKITNYSHETIRKILNGLELICITRKRNIHLKFFITIQIFGIPIGNFTFKKTLIFRYNFIMSKKKGEII